MEGIESIEIDRKYKEDIFNKPLNELELSYKSANGLRKDNIMHPTIYHLLQNINGPSNIGIGLFSWFQH